MQNKKWTLRTASVDAQKVAELSGTYGIPPIVATILLKRGIENFDEFLSPSTDKFRNPFLMKDMDKAVARIIRAIEAKETVSVYGDYDVDGISSTAILTSFLRSRGVTVSYYIPDRHKEGYGINKSAIDTIVANGSKLMITVDCGITAVEETIYAKENGLDMIITDHHECKDTLPDAVAVLNPKRQDCDYPFKHLAGVGVVFKLLEALAQEIKLHKQALYEECLDIVALGTVADVMPLIGENRIIVHNGLENLSYSRNKGLCALMRQSSTDPSRLSTGTIGFSLAPRINAAGRVGNPLDAVSLLLAEDDKTANTYAEILDAANRSRQADEQHIFDDAMALLASDDTYKTDKILVLAAEGWHQGIIGIVASRITERFHKPCILISLDGESGKGSGRSIKNFNLFAALSSCGDLLTRFGGHELAAGLTLPTANLQDFRKAINSYAEEVLKPEDSIPELVVDAELPLEYINLHTVDKLSVMAPYGMGNPSPVFVCRNLTITGIRLLSEGKHIRLLLTDGQHMISAIGFSMGTLAETLKTRQKIDIAFTLDSNLYRGERQVQVILKDVKECAQ